METQDSTLTNQDADQLKFRVQLHVTGVEPVQPRLITDSRQQAAAATAGRAQRRRQEQQASRQRNFHRASRTLPSGRGGFQLGGFQALGLFQAHSRTTPFHKTRYLMF